MKKIITNEKKKTKMTRPGFEHETSSVASGYSYRLAIDVSCYRKLNKLYIREIRDSIKRTELRPKLEF